MLLVITCDMEEW